MNCQQFNPEGSLGSTQPFLVIKATNSSEKPRTYLWHRHGHCFTRNSAWHIANNAMSQPPVVIAVAMHIRRLPHHGWPTMTSLLSWMTMASRLLGLLSQFQPPTSQPIKNESDLASDFIPILSFHLIISVSLPA